MGDTSLVQQRLHDRVLVKASAPEAKAAAKPAAPTDPEASLKALENYGELAAAGYGDAFGHGLHVPRARQPASMSISALVKIGQLPRFPFRKTPMNR